MRDAAHELGWVRAVEQLRAGPRRQAALCVGGQLVAAGVFAVLGLAALPHLRALEDLLLAAAFGVSARSTALAARRTVWWDSYPVAQLAAVVVLALAGVVGAGGPAVPGLPYVLLVLFSAPYLHGLQAAVVVAGCAAGHLVALVLHDAGPGIAQRWLTLTGLLIAVVVLTASRRPDRDALEALVRLEVTDRVTGLPTARYLEQAGRDAAARTARGGPIAVVALRVEDLDEQVRAHGHDLVDMALERLAGRLRTALRNGDELARTGPDELVALLPGADADAADEVAGALRAVADDDLEGGAADAGVVRLRLTTGVSAAQPRHPAGRVADLVERARANRPAPAAARVQRAGG